jgi:hypothetical protein
MAEPRSSTLLVRLQQQDPSSRGCWTIYALSLAGHHCCFFGRRRVGATETFCMLATEGRAASSQLLATLLQGPVEVEVCACPTSLVEAPEPSDDSYVYLDCAWACAEMVALAEFTHARISLEDVGRYVSLLVEGCTLCCLRRTSTERRAAKDDVVEPLVGESLV